MSWTSMLCRLVRPTGSEKIILKGSWNYATTDPSKITLLNDVLEVNSWSHHQLAARLPHGCQVVNLLTEVPSTCMCSTKMLPDEPTNREKAGVFFFFSTTYWNLSKKTKLFISVFATNGGTWFYPLASRNKAVKMWVASKSLLFVTY